MYSFNKQLFRSEPGAWGCENEFCPQELVGEVWGRGRQLRKQECRDSGSRGQTCTVLLSGDFVDEPEFLCIPGTGNSQ